MCYFEYAFQFRFQIPAFSISNLPKIKHSKSKTKVYVKMQQKRRNAHLENGNIYRMQGQFCRYCISILCFFFLIFSSAMDLKNKALYM